MSPYIKLGGYRTSLAGVLWAGRLTGGLTGELDGPCIKR